MDYNKQATDFLTETGTTLSYEFEKFDYHFDGDKQKRNIFKVTLANTRHKFVFRFGTSLNDSLKNSKDVIYEADFDFYYGLRYEGLKREFLSYSDKISLIKAKAAYDNSISSLLDKQRIKATYEAFVKGNANRYRTLNIISFKDWTDKINLALIRKLNELSAKNWGEGIPADMPIAPTPYDVLASLERYEVTTFEDFCSNYGYDTDSRSAYKTYKAVMREWKNVEKLFRQDELNQLREIQ